MSGSNSDDQGNMSDHVSTNTTANTGIAVWDDKAVSDMYFLAVEINGGFSKEAAEQIEQRMRERGYNFTAKQIQTKHANYRRNKVGPASNRTAEVKPKAKTAPKPHAKAAPKIDADGNPTTRAKTPRKPAAKRAPKSSVTPKTEVDDNGDEVASPEAEGPPNKKRKAAGPKAKKVIVHETVQAEDAEEAEEECDAPDGEPDTSMVDADDFNGSENSVSASAAAAKITKDNAGADAQKVKDKAESDAEMTKVDAAHAAEMIKADAQVEEEDDAPEGEFAEQIELVQASKSDGVAEETVRIEAHVVQTSA